MVHDLARAILRLIRGSSCEQRPSPKALTIYERKCSNVTSDRIRPTCLRFPAFLTGLVQRTRARAATKSVRETSAAEAWSGDTTKTTIDADDNRWDGENRARPSLSASRSRNSATASWLAYTRWLFE